MYKMGEGGSGRLKILFLANSKLINVGVSCHALFERVISNSAYEGLANTGFGKR